MGAKALKVFVFALSLLILIAVFLLYSGNTSYSTEYSRFLLVSAAILLTVSAGIISGLTLGLMSLDETKLKILLSSGTPQEQSFAARIIPIRSDPYLLLCTLLASNAVISESLPIVIDRIVGEGWKAILASTIILLLFGELIPQAYFSRYGLAAGARFSGLVKILTFFLAPLVYPLSFALKRMLGKGPHQSTIQYRRNELKALVALLVNTQLTHDEVDILTGVLDLIGSCAVSTLDKTPRTLMTPLNNVFMLEADQPITSSVVQMIAEKGYSRIPLVSNGEIVSILLTRRLLGASSSMTLGSLATPRSSLLTVPANCSLFEIFRLLREGHRISHVINIDGHMALVSEEEEWGSDRQKAPLIIGIITIEDIIEEIINNDIYDESDLSQHRSPVNI